MPLDDALSYVRQIAGVDGLRGISITGGEPFLRYSVLAAVIEEAGGLGLGARIVSNCYWAKSRAIAAKRLAPLVEHGLGELSVSYDAVHEEFVAKERVQNAIETALDFGLKVVVSTVHARGDIDEYTERIRADLGLPAHERLFVMPGYIVPGGRARHRFKLEDLALVDGDDEAGERLRHPCPHVIREPIITPNGDLAACCSPSTATRSGIHDAFIVGSLKRRSLRELLDELESSTAFNQIMLDGPWALYEMVREADPGAIRRTKFVNICDLCQAVMTNPRAQAVLARRVPAQRTRLMVKKLSLQASAGGDVDDFLTRRYGLVQMRPHK